MSEQDKQSEDIDRDERTVARLLELAGPGSPVPRDVEERVYRRVHAEWKTSTTGPDASRVYPQVRREWEKGPLRGGRRRWGLPLALAATAVLAVAVLWQSPPPSMPEIAVGNVVRVAGSGATALPLVGEDVFPGDRLTTGDGDGIGLMLANTASLRVDGNTELIVESANLFRLVRGRVYADTGDSVYRDRSLTIEASGGSITDVGTQFSVAAEGRRLDIAVREGRVDVTAGAGEHVAVAGERMQLAADGTATYTSIQPHDDYWHWAARLAPPYEIEDGSLLEFLRWASRETGRELVFDNQGLRMAAMRTDLHGSVAGFGPDDALESVLAGTDFDYRIETTRIVITKHGD